VIHALLLLASSAMAIAPHIENAVTIHTATRDYLEFDIAPVTPCQHPAVTGLSMRGAGTAVVQWTLPAIVLDPTCLEKTTRANVLLPFPESVGGTHGAVVLDTLNGTGGDVVTKIGRVQNPAPPTMCPMIACVLEDSSKAFQKVQARIKSSAFVVALAPPPPVQTFLAVSPWRATTGSENYPEIVAPLAGNVGNWIAEYARQLAMVSQVAGKMLPVVLPDIALPTGPADYFYQQAGNPFRSDWSVPL